MFKVGDTVRFIENPSYIFSLTKYNTYNVLGVVGDMIKILNDSGETQHYYSKRFELATITMVQRSLKVNYVDIRGNPLLKDKTSEQRKAEPIHAGVLSYFPDALAAVSRVSKAGNDKHNPGQPLHWSRGKSNDNLDCIARHIITPLEIDTDSNELHLAHAAWRALAALQLAEEKRLKEAGIKSLSGVQDNG